MNEPQCFIGLGLLDGAHAPGDKLNAAGYLTAAHNAMRAHAKAVQVLRARAKDAKGTKVGYVLAAQITQPASDKPRTSRRRARRSSPSATAASGTTPGSATRCCSASIPRTA